MSDKEVANNNNGEEIEDQGTSENSDIEDARILEDLPPQVKKVVETTMMM